MPLRRVSKHTNISCESNKYILNKVLCKTNIGSLRNFLAGNCNILNDIVISLDYYGNRGYLSSFFLYRDGAFTFSIISPNGVVTVVFII